MGTLLVDVWQKMGLDRDAHTPDKCCCLGIDRRVLPGLMLTVDGPVRDGKQFYSRTKVNLTEVILTVDAECSEELVNDMPIAVL